MENTNLLDEAYKKILADKELQTKFMEAAKENKLEVFLKEENIDATLDEVKEYLTKKFTDENGKLIKEELDEVAGGKIGGEEGTILLSIFTLGVGCLVSAAKDHKCTL